MHNLPTALKNIVACVERKIAPRLAELDQQALANEDKVLAAFQAEQVAESDLIGSTGYGTNDEGRDKLDRIWARIFKTEDALVRSQFVSGTHTIATAMSGNLLPGDELIYLTGMPYDTLQQVIGIAGHQPGSLKDYGIQFDYVPLKNDAVDANRVQQVVAASQPKMVVIQRSRGYATRPSLTVSEIRKLIALVRRVSPQTIILIDNCYGEFSELHEPTEYGADLMAGSLIKNGGGGYAKTGGYIVGKHELIERAANRLTCAGIGREEGASLGNNRDYYQGLFVAPEITANAIKGAVYTAALLAEVGETVSPLWDEARTDLIQTAVFNDRTKMIKFAQVLQQNSPVNAFVEPIPSNQDGYEDQIIMAGGSFVNGATVEFSGDGPIRPPYALYLQGGLTFVHIKLAITNTVAQLYFNN
ncbi:MAG: methionine gamma-lyase family protein [Lactobacillus sp.]|nr:methionine gamma-lyase family protein [Lactobacillus sp.]MDN6052003.1 methionine gamma-lyase family protein [Lactobacillus sp.]